MTKKKINLAGKYEDEKVAILGNNPEKRGKPKMRDLDSVSHYEVVEAVEKQRRNIEKKRLMEIERIRQVEMEHPRIAKAVPYLRIGAVAMTIIVLIFVFWIISQLPAFNVPL